ncbi:hypothetical protein BaRGS_00025836, partial [Batillaria attramentaria]
IDSPTDFRCSPRPEGKLYTMSRKLRSPQHTRKLNGYMPRPFCGGFSCTDSLKAFPSADSAKSTTR